MSIAIKAFRLVIDYIINSECFTTSPFLVHARISDSPCYFLHGDVADIHNRLSTGWAFLAKLLYALAANTMPIRTGHNDRWHHVVEAYWAFEFADDILVRILFVWLHPADKISRNNAQSS
jgi:hypothetical protein